MKKQFALITVCISTLMLIYLSSCKKSDNTTTTTATTATTTPTLYTQVGGTTLVADPKNSGTQIEKGRLTLRSVVDSSINVIAADAQLAPYFPTLFAELGANNTTGLTALSKNFTDFLCTATGSTNATYQYTGLSMAAAHNHATYARFGAATPTTAAAVNATDFNKFVGDIGIGLGKNGVTQANNASLFNALVALLNTTQSAIVQR